MNKELFNRIRRLEIVTGKLAQEITVGDYHSAFKGKGMEFEEVREYVEGDDTRSIDWNVTARMNHAYVKSFKEERELSVMILVDISPSTLFGSGGQRKKDLMIEIASLLAFTAIKNNDNVGLLLFSDQVEKFVSPNKGVKHVLRIIRELLVSESLSSTSLLEPALEYLGRVQKRRCVCFILSDFILNLSKESLAPLAKKHDLIAVYVYDLLDNMPTIGVIECADLESNRMEIIDTANAEVKKRFYESDLQRKKAFLKLMNQIGGDYLFLTTNQPYEKELKKFFRMRKLKHS